MMELTKEDIELLIEKLQPKIKSVLSQTSPKYREDLEQELKVNIVKKIREGKIDSNVPGFFEYLTKD